MQESRSNIEREFQTWHEGKTRQNEDIPQHLWSLLYEHIASHGEEEVPYLARRLGLPWARLRGKWLKWRDVHNKIVRETAQAKSDMASEAPAIELADTNAVRSNREEASRSQDVSRKRRVIRRNSGRKTTNIIEPDSDEVLHITRISIPQGPTDSNQNNQENNQLLRVYHTSASCSHNTACYAARPQEISGTSASISNSVTRWMALISSDKLKMELGPGLSAFDIADIFVSISMRMTREGEHHGLASISDN